MGRDRASHMHGQVAISLVPRQISMFFCLVTRLHVRICTKLENGNPHQGQQPQNVVNGFY